MPLSFDLELKVEFITLPQISDDLYEHLEKITNIHPQITEAMLVPILQSNPDSNVEVCSTENLTFARWTKKASPRDARSPKLNCGRLQRHTGHDTAWAIIAAKLISIARRLTNADSVFTDYSAQYLLDCYDPPRREEGKKLRYCCTIGSVEEGINYALKMKIPRKIDWDYKGCRRRSEFVAPHAARFSVRGEIQHINLQYAIVGLKYQPVAAKLHLFTPDDDFAKNEIYVGPKYWKSTYVGLIDVMVYGTKIVEGQLVAVVKCPCAKVECLNVSLDVQLVRLWDNIPQEKNNTDIKRLDKPTRLLTEFLVLS